jgi:hypothetical protein
MSWVLMEGRGCVQLDGNFEEAGDNSMDAILDLERVEVRANRRWKAICWLVLAAWEMVIQFSRNSTTAVKRVVVKLGAMACVCNVLFL